MDTGLENPEASTEKLPAGMPKLITISTDGTGKYYASYGVEQVINHLPKTGNMVGIDAVMVANI
jgi:hypothetical protein